MNWDRVLGRWMQLKGRVNIGWARVTADPRREIAGERAMLAGQLQVAYGIGCDDAHRYGSDPDAREVENSFIARSIET